MGIKLKTYATIVTSRVLVTVTVSTPISPGRSREGASVFHIRSKRYGVRGVASLTVRCSVGHGRGLCLQGSGSPHDSDETIHQRRRDVSCTASRVSDACTLATRGCVKDGPVPVCTRSALVTETCAPAWRFSIGPMPAGFFESKRREQRGAHCHVREGHDRGHGRDLSVRERREA